MKLLADQINVFVDETTTKDGAKIKNFKTSIGSKDQEGNYTNKSLEVSFSKDALSKDALAKLVSGYVYSVEVRDGFLTCRSYQNKQGQKVTILVAKILKCKVLGRKELAVKDNTNDQELPF